MSAVWRLEMLGDLRVLGADRTITRFSTQKTAELLAYLALHPRRAHARELLIELLWPECEPAAGRNRLSVALSSLRRQLEPPGVPAGAVIAAGRSFVRLNSTALVTDVEEFLRALTLARAAQGGRQQAAWKEAAALYQGELLPGFYEDWIETERRQLGERARQALEALARTGSEAEAREWSYRAAALDSRGAEPHEHGTLLLTRPTDAPPRTRRPAARPDRPVTRPVYSAREERTPSQPRAGGGPEPLAERHGFTLPAPLPLRPNRFFGRGKELSRLEELLAPDGDARLVTLTGAGGSGKTRLAVEAAHRLAARFDGRVHFVSLAECRDATQLPALLMQALRVLPCGEESVPERLSLALGGRPVLVLLDNFEQLVEDESVEFLRALLEAAPAIRWLITSRRRLGLQSERELSVPPLSLPGAALPESLETLLEAESVRLLVERAQAARPDFQLTRNNAATVAEICRRLEGLPLALELAAARTQVLSPRQILAQLEHRFELLVSRQRDRIPRHRTLRAAVEWSYHLLPPARQEFFARLSVFRGGWTADAAAEVCDHPDALESLADLCDSSLVRVDGAAEPFRFQMFEMLREDGESRLCPEERAAVRSRHAAYYARWLDARVAHGALRVPLAAVDAEVANLRAALAWSLEQDGGLALRLATALEPYWHLRNLWSEGRTMLERALAAAPDAPPPLRAWALHAVGHLAARQRDPDARTLLLEALGLARELDDHRLEAAVLRHRIFETHAEHLAGLRTSLALAERIGEPHAVATSAAVLADVLVQPHPEEAQRLYAQALELFRELEDRLGEAQVLNNLGVAAMEREEWLEAEALLESSLEIRRETEDLQGLAMTLFNLGAVADSLAKRERAHALIAEAHSRYQEAGDFGGILLCLRILGDMDREAGRLSEAEPRLVAALHLAVSRRDSWAGSIALQGLAPLLAACGRARAAVRALGAASQMQGGDWKQLDPNLSGLVTELRARLGEARFLAAMAEGARLSWQELPVLVAAAGLKGGLRVL